jgi:hypothetical protein
MTEVKYNQGAGTPAERIAKRLANSGAGAKSDISTKQGDGPTRVHHNIHHSGSVGGTKVDDGEPKGGRR